MTFGIILMITFAFQIREQECLNNIVTRNEDVYILSEKATTYQDAEEKCQQYGGQIAQISSLDERNFLRTHLEEKFTQNQLSTVDVHKLPGAFHPIPGGFFYDSYKYRSRNGYMDTSSVSEFTTPPDDELKSFKLYRRPVPGFSELVHFCWFPGRDIIRSVCNTGWNNNFQLYGGTADANDTITLYNYIPMGLTSELFFGPIFNSSFEIANVPKIFLPDISVFVGTQSLVGESDWFWNNGTMVNDPRYPTSNKSSCHLMTWPLTYDDGINLRAKSCKEEALHICLVKVAIELEEIRCDANALRLTLPPILERNATVQVIVSPNRIINVPQNSSQLIIEGLTQQTNYSFQVNAQFHDCPTCQLFVSAYGRTGFGTPAPVSSAHVLNSVFSNCVIAWKHARPVNEEIEYQIIAHSGKLSSITTVTPQSHPNAHFLGDVAIQEIDLIHHGFNNTVTFQIQAITSCGVRSALVNVKGSCSTRLSLRTTSTTETTVTIKSAMSNLNEAQNNEQKLYVWVLIGAVTLLLLVFLFAEVSRRIRKSQKKQQMNVNSNESNVDNQDRISNGQTNTAISYEGYNEYDKL